MTTTNTAGLPVEYIAVSGNLTAEDVKAIRNLIDQRDHARDIACHLEGECARLTDTLEKVRAELAKMRDHGSCGCTNEWQRAMTEAARMIQHAMDGE